MFLCLACLWVVAVDWIVFWCFEVLRLGYFGVLVFWVICCGVALLGLRFSGLP